ncbi:MAG: XTP/dITP diphosphatase [Elusimicrobia bacterium]|nr:XTP/dITP diphosphatase [Elusimicrobiota bacterium]MBD3412159.1 XTP/dITP diphosphatase [Elusimicrobiota bacterium]
MSIPLLILSTRNENKVKEIKALLTGFPITVKSLQDYPDAPNVEETGKTFEENAVLKAKAIAQYTGKWTFADDSGLEVQALNGQPGVRSARYAGNGCTYDDNNKKLLHALEGVPSILRKARFVCVMALSSPEGKVWSVEGVCDGFISKQPKGDNGFGYDPVFYYPSEGKTFAEMPFDKKNELSHRSKALKNFLKLLQSLQN